MMATQRETLIGELQAGDASAMSRAASFLESLPNEIQLAEKIHAATGLNLRCCSEAAREIIEIYE